MSWHDATLAHAADVQGWRDAARGLLARRVPPEAVAWRVAGDADAGAPAGLFDAPQPAAQPPIPPASPAHQVPAAFIALAEHALLHSQPQRFALLYRLLWRLVQEPALRHDSLDPDRVAAEALARQVRRDMHKMKAFVRFTERPTAHGPRFVAWFEPEHHIVDAVAPFFMRRFTGMHWSIVTPRRSVRWDGRALAFGPGARRDEVVAEDAQEALWLTYYEHIFNPARLKLDAMQSEMPRKYWHNLPEARLIAPLAAQARQRTDTMLSQPASVPQRRRPALPALVDGRSARDAAAGCLDCPHARHATQAVWGEGPAKASVMLVGEQPGDQEDLAGRPFVGPAGQLLDRALADAGLDRGTLYLTNAVKHFRFELRGKRRLHKSPGQRELQACSRWLEQEVAEVGARRLVALGASAAQSLLGERVAVSEYRGRWLERPDGRQVLVTWHPAALLRLPPEAQAPAYRQWVDDLAQIERVSQAH